MVDGGRCRWIDRRWRRWSWRGGLLFLFPRLMVITGDDGSAATSTGVAGVTGIVTGAVTASVVGIVATAAAAATALSFSAVAFSVPVAMHLSRYGRLPSWNKFRAQCLVIFHSSTMKGILATAICCNFLLLSNVFKYV